MRKELRGSIYHIEDFEISKDLLDELEYFRKELSDKKGYDVSIQVVIRYIWERYKESR